MNIQNFIAYASDGNLGGAYNKAMALLKDPDDWGAFVDHDAMMVQKYWFSILERAIKENPQYGLFTCYTNRVNNPQQILKKFKDKHGQLIDPKFGTNALYSKFVRGRGLNKQKKGSNWNNHDMAYHFKLGKQIPTEKITVTKLPASPPLSGVFMVCKKDCWNKIGGAKSGFLTIDNDLHRRVVKEGSY